jgi:hypothetical protein
VIGRKVADASVSRILALYLSLDIFTLHRLETKIRGARASTRIMQYGWLQLGSLEGAEIATTLYDYAYTRVWVIPREWTSLPFSYDHASEMPTVT